MLKQQTLRHKGRSREGARIEIAARHAATVANQRRSREGARIEMVIKNAMQSIDTSLP